MNPCLDVLSQVPFGSLDRNKEPWPKVVPSVFSGQFEDLQAVLGYGDSHALEELVVEVGYVFFFELVVGEN